MVFAGLLFMSLNLSMVASRFIWMSFFLTGPAFASVQAIVQCRSSQAYFHEHFLSLPPSTKFELPTDFVQTVLQHPIMKLGEKMKGKQIIFESGSLKFNGEIVPIKMGESIQLHFVGKILKLIFPQSQLVTSVADSGSKTRSGRQSPVARIEIKISDSGELGNYIGDEVLEMSVLKTVNPGLSSSVHNRFRSAFGVAPEARVVSIYSRDLKDMDKIFESVESASRPDYIFFTMGGDPVNSRFRRIFEKWLSRPHDIVNLSELVSFRKHPDRSVLVFNDVAGKVPYVANISDLVIVNGPINFFEPLTSGAKTVIISSPQNFNSKFNHRLFADMLETAVATKGAFPADDVQELESVLRMASRSEAAIVAPYKLRIHGQDRTVANVFLDILQTYLEKLMKAHGVSANE
jgi:hypothetical protein